MEAYKNRVVLQEVKVESEFESMLGDSETKTKTYEVKSVGRNVDNSPEEDLTVGMKVYIDPKAIGNTFTKNGQEYLVLTKDRVLVYNV